ncbi:hypothetical protein [Planococcus rifietoensis]|uniref:hypothetical protein n=1 Tax=Planococcus rifietoensis TaxID=200991 RepID=UPI00384B59A1
MDRIDTEIKNKTLQIVKMAQAAEFKVKEISRENEEKIDITFELLEMLDLSDDLVELFNPSKTSGEYFGLPKDNVLGSNQPREIITNNGINFTSWFGEKTKNIKDGVKTAISYLRINLDTLKLVEGAPMTNEEYKFDGVKMGLYNARINGETILEMLERETNT